MAVQPAAAFNIVQAGMNDIDVVVPLFDQYRMFYGQTSDRGLAERFIRARVQHRDSVLFLAIEGEDVDEVALGFTLLYPSFNSVMAEAIWILNDIYVQEAARRRGVARALIEHGRQLSEDTGARGLSLSTGKENASSHQLYESMGFARDDKFCTYLLKM